MAYTNKFILTSDESDLVRGLSTASKAYNESMNSMVKSANSLRESEKKLGEENARLMRLQAVEIDRLKKGKDTTAIKESIALQKKVVRLQKSQVALAKTARKEAELTNKNISGAVNLYNKSISTKQKELALEEKLTYEKRKQDVLARRVAQTSNRKQVESDKDRLLVTSTEEQSARKYAGMLKEINELKRRGIITDKQATVATERLTAAQKLQATGVKNLRNSIVRHIRQVESLLVALYLVKRAYDATLGTGHEYNKLMERETVGLKLLIAQNRENVDAQGRALTSQQKYTNAQHEAAKALKIIRQINVETPHTLGETFQIYKLLTPQVLRYGGTLEEVGKITRNVSVSAAAMGIEFQQLLKTVDSLMSGQMKESGLKRAMEQFGISQKDVNKTIKEGGDVVGLFIEKLKQVDPAAKEITSTWAGVTAQFRNAWEEIWGDSQKGLFNDMKKTIASLGGYLKENKDTIVSIIGVVGDLAISVGILTAAFYALNSSFTFSGMTAYFSSLAAGTTAAAAGVTTLSGAMKLLISTNPILLALTAALAAFTYQSYLAREEQEGLDRALDMTTQAFRDQNKVIREGTMATLTKDIVNTREEFDALTKRLKEGGRTVYGIQIGADSEDKKSELRAEQALLAEKLQSTEEQIRQLKMVSDVRLQITDLLKQEMVSITKLGIEESKIEGMLITQFVKHGEIDNITRDRLNTVVKEREEHRQIKAELDKQKTAMDGVADGARNVKNEVNGIAGALSEATKQAYSLQSILLKAKITRGEISELEGIEQTKDQGLRDANNEGDAVKALQVYEDYKTSIFNLNKKTAEQQNTAAKELYNLKTDIYSLEGNTAVVQERKIANIKKEYTGERQIAELKKAQLEYDQSMVKTTSSGGSKRYRTAKKESKQIEKIELKRIGGLEETAMQAGQDIADSWATSFDAFFNGDLVGFANSAFGDMFDGLRVGFADMFGGITSGFGQLASGLLGAGIGFGLELLSGLFSSVGAAPEDLNQGANSESLANFEKVMADVQNPLLQLTYSMDQHLSSIEASFTGLGNAINLSSFDYGSGGGFEDFSKGTGLGGIWGQKSSTLVGAGIQFRGGSIQDYIQGNVDAWTVQQIEKTKSSWFGLKSKTWTDTNKTPLADKSFANAIGMAAQDSIEMMMESASALGIGTGALSSFTIDDISIDSEGKSGEEIAAEIESKLSAQLDAVANAQFGALEEYQKRSEGLMETAVRIGIENEQVAHSLNMMGVTLVDSAKTFDLFGLKITYGTTKVYELTQAMIKGAGSIGDLQTGISSYMDNFFTVQEQYEMQVVDLTKSFETLNTEMPRSKEEFRAVAEAIDLTTESGAELYGEMMVLSEGFADFQDSTESLISEMNELNFSMQSLLGDIFSSILNGVTSYADAINSIGVILGHESESLVAVGSLIEGATIESFDRIAAAIEAARAAEEAAIQSVYDERMKALNEELSALTSLYSALDSVQSVIDSLRVQDSSESGVSAAREEFLLLQEEIRVLVGENQDVAELLKKYAAAGAEYAKIAGNLAGSSQEREFLNKQIASMMATTAEGATPEATVGDVETAIADLTSVYEQEMADLESLYMSLQEELFNRMSDDYETYLNDQIDFYTTFLGEDSPVVQGLMSLLGEDGMATVESILASVSTENLESNDFLLSIRNYLSAMDMNAIATALIENGDTGLLNLYSTTAIEQSTASSALYAQYLYELALDNNAEMGGTYYQIEENTRFTNESILAGNAAFNIYTTRQLYLMEQAELNAIAREEQRIINDEALAAQVVIDDALNAQLIADELAAAILAAEINSAADALTIANSIIASDQELMIAYTASSELIASEFLAANNATAINNTAIMQSIAVELNAIDAALRLEDTAATQFIVDELIASNAALIASMAADATDEATEVNVTESELYLQMITLAEQAAIESLAREERNNVQASALAAASLSEVEDARIDANLAANALLNVMGAITPDTIYIGNILRNQGIANRATINNARFLLSSIGNLIISSINGSTDYIVRTLALQNTANRQHAGNIGIAERATITNARTAITATDTINTTRILNTLNLQGITSRQHNGNIGTANRQAVNIARVAITATDTSNTTRIFNTLNIQGNATRQTIANQNVANRVAINNMRVAINATDTNNTTRVLNVLRAQGIANRATIANHAVAGREQQTALASWEVNSLTKGFVYIGDVLKNINSNISNQNVANRKQQNTTNHLIIRNTRQISSDIRIQTQRDRVHAGWARGHTLAEMVDEWGYPVFRNFADGGIVTSPTKALIGEAGYPEAVLPLKDPNDPLGMTSVNDTLKSLNNTMEKTNERLSTIEDYNRSMSKNLTAQTRIQVETQEIIEERV